MRMFWGDRQNAPRPSQDRIVFRPKIAFASPEQTHTRKEQECAEGIKYPGEALYQRRSDSNHRPTQHQCTQQAPMEYPMLQRRFDAKCAKNQEEDENVVQAERFFHDVAGEKFQSRGTAMRQENPKIKAKRQHYPNCAPYRRLRKGNTVCAPMKSKINRERDDDTCIEHGPKNGRAH